MPGPVQTALIRKTPLAQLQDVVTLESANEPCVSGETPLHVAARVGAATEIFELLVDRGADLTRRNAEGRTPLFVALVNDASLATLRLLAREDVVGSSDVEGDTPLHHVGKAQRPAETTRLLIERGASVVAVDRHKSTPMHTLASYAWFNPDSIQHDETFVSVFDQLVAKGAAVDARNGPGITPLHAAVFHGARRLVLPLLRAKAEPRSCTKAGQWIVHTAAAKGDVEVLRALLEYGAGTTARSKSDETPLQWAAAFERQACVDLLMSAGADAAAARRVPPAMRDAYLQACVLGLPPPKEETGGCVIF